MNYTKEQLEAIAKIAKAYHRFEKFNDSYQIVNLPPRKIDFRGDDITSRLANAENFLDALRNLRTIVPSKLLRILKVPDLKELEEDCLGYINRYKIS